MIDDPNKTAINVPLTVMTPPLENIWNSEEINNDVAEFLKNIICDENEWQTLRDIKIKYLGQLFFRGLSMTNFCREINNDNEVTVRKNYDNKGNLKRGLTKNFINNSFLIEFAPFKEIEKILEGMKKIAGLVVILRSQRRHNTEKEYYIKKGD